MSQQEREPRVIEEQQTGEDVTQPDGDQPNRLPDAFEHATEHQEPLYPDPRDWRDDPPPRPAPRPAPAPPTPAKETVIHHADGTVETRSADGSVNLAFRNGSSEFRHANGEVIRSDIRHGTIEHSWPDGTRQVEYSNGHVESYQNDGSVLTAYGNGNFDQRQPDGTVEHWRVVAPGEEPRRVSIERPDGSWETRRLDGTVITTYPDRSIVIQRSDGSSHRTSLDQPSETRNSDGSVALRFANGSSETREVDGTVRRYDALNGTATTERPDGTSEIIHGSDGRVATINPDGVVTAYSNGVKVISHRDGRIERTNDQGVVVEVENPDGTWDFHWLDGRVQHSWNDGTLVIDRPDGIQQVFWPDNTEELRDPSAGDEPVQPPQQDVPVVAGSAYAFDTRDEPMSAGTFSEEVAQMPLESLEELDARGVVGPRAAVQASDEGSNALQADDDPLGVGAQPAPGDSADAVLMAAETVAPAEPVGVAAQGEPEPAFDADTTMDVAVAITQFGAETTSNLSPSGAVASLAETSVEGWDAATGSSEQIQRAVENEDVDWTQ